MVNGALGGAREGRAMILDAVKAVFALAVTLGLVGLAAYAARRWGPAGLVALQKPLKERRLALVESLPLDAQRRLVLIRLDGRERLVLLGEGRLIEADLRRPEA
jgi:flagellar protein FliO/FliZ